MARDGQTRESADGEADVTPVSAAHALTRERVSGDAATLLGSGERPVLARASSLPETIDRYVVLRRLGAGGMGEVYAAYDNELDRPVAIKLLLGRRGGGEAQRRMLREAQGLARLSHPNVVQVYEVGRHRGQVFIAMELLRGQTLGDWLDGLPLPRIGAVQRRIIDVFVQAGRGLSAAHGVGLVHRDFKPNNTSAA